MGGVSRDPKFVLRNIWTALYWIGNEYENYNIDNDDDENEDDDVFHGANYAKSSCKCCNLQRVHLHRPNNIYFFIDPLGATTWSNGSKGRSMAKLVQGKIFGLMDLVICRQATTC